MSNPHITRAPATTGLLDLSTELLQEIAALLPLSQDVAAVARTCRMLNLAASGILYKNIRLRIDDSEGRPSKLYSIIRLGATLYREDPALRSSTKSISITLPDTRSVSNSRLCPPELQFVCRVPSVTEHRKRWGLMEQIQRDHLMQGELWAFMTLLLRACLNLRKLTLDGNFYQVLSFWRTDLAQFPLLETVELITSDVVHVPRANPCSQVFQGLARLPNLRKLRLTASGSWVHPGILIEQPLQFPTYPHLTVLVLWRSELPMYTLRALLALMPNLVRFEIDIMYAIHMRCHDFDIAYACIDLRKLGKAIRGKGLIGPLRECRDRGFHFSRKLETLKISLGFCTKTCCKSLLDEGYDSSQSLAVDDDPDGYWDSEESDSENESEDDFPDNEDDNDGDQDYYDDAQEGVSCHTNHNLSDTFGPGTRWGIYGLGSLKTLPKLKTLEIDPMLLFGDRRDEPCQLDEQGSPRYSTRWRPLDAILPASLQELHITSGYVEWFLCANGGNFLKTRGAGTNPKILIEMFQAYKERGGKLAQLHKVVHLAHSQGQDWSEEQNRLKDLLECLDIRYECSS
ncbi:hypothetical protein SLS56_002576 [Neofusicoccum ribis]|uniref:F-box domain-containing protein n=1 Tax=Neofusicoccum ribis TaxID=45134 RepID=A0ABR3T331_9PEZI